MGPFGYRDLGPMATLGRNRTVAEFSRVRTQSQRAVVLDVELFHL